jgi:hypothetical protein
MEHLLYLYEHLIGPAHSTHIPLPVFHWATWTGSTKPPSELLVRIRNWRNRYRDIASRERREVAVHAAASRPGDPINLWRKEEPRARLHTLPRDKTKLNTTVTMGPWINSQDPPNPIDPNTKCRYRMGAEANPAKGTPIIDIEDYGRKRHSPELELLRERVFERMLHEGYRPWKPWDGVKAVADGVVFPNYEFMKQGGGFPESQTGEECKRADRGSVALRALWQGILGNEVKGFAITYRARSEAELIEMILCGGLYKPCCFKFQYADGSLSKVNLDRNPRTKEEVDSLLKQVKKLCSLRKLVFPRLQLLFNPGGWRDWDGCGWQYFCPQPVSKEFEDVIRNRPDFDIYVRLYQHLFSNTKIVEMAALVPGDSADALGKRLATAARNIADVAALWETVFRIDLLKRPHFSKSGPLYGTHMQPWQGEVKAIFDEVQRRVIENARREAKRGITTPQYAKTKAGKAQKRVEHGLAGARYFYNDFLKPPASD